MRFQELKVSAEWPSCRSLSTLSERAVAAARGVSPLPTAVCMALLCATVLLRWVVVEAHARRALRLHKMA